MFEDLLENLNASIGTRNKSREVPLDSKNFKAFTITTPNESYGVVIPFDSNDDIDESFNNIKFKTIPIFGQKYLGLFCDIKEFMVSFASLAWDFIKCGENDTNRKDILTNPYGWFEKWKKFVGNYDKSLMVYDVIGELKCLLLLAEKGAKPKWTSTVLSCHDIEANGESYEVKTTLSHEGKTIHVSSLEQLMNEDNTPLNILLVRVQKSPNGDSIKSLRDQLVGKNYIDPKEIDEYLAQKVFSPKKLEYENVKYSVYHIVKYRVDDDFPKITLKNFVDGKLPKGVEGISYTIELPNNGEELLLK